MPRTDQEITQFLWDTGHFFNPLNPSGMDVTADDLPKMKLTDTPALLAIQSYQDMSCGALDHLCVRRYGRISRPDGVALEATRELFQKPRCGHPDYYHPDESHPMSRTGLGLLAAGSGSFPPGCHGSEDWFQATYSVDKRNMAAPNDSEWLQARKLVVDNYATFGMEMIERPLGDRVNITLILGAILGGSTIGLAQFNNRTCGDVIFCKLDRGYWPNVFQGAQLLAHEWGHNNKADHTRMEVMTPTIGPWVGGFIEGDPTLEVFRRYYGGKPIPKDPDDPPIPPTDPAVIYLSGITKIMQGGKVLGEFTYDPVPRV